MPVEHILERKEEKKKEDNIKRNEENKAREETKRVGP